MCGGGAEGGRENPKQTLSVEPEEELNPTIVTWAKIKSQMVNQLSHQSAPIFFKFIYLFWARERAWVGDRGQRENLK